ncbi:hypothetical protein ACWGJ2_10620 [Streptomyces sp. NPDC054796]
MQRRGLVHAAAWTLATGAAVTLSWFGVHTVLSGTAYDPPRALPLSEASPSQAEPRASSTHRPKPSPSSAKPSTSAPRKPSKPPGTGSSSKKPSTGSRSPSGAAPEGNVEGETVAGGRAVFDMGEASASLVSATPHAGWDMRVWRADHWIRVTFTKGDTSSSVFCRWDDGPPRLETFEG